jgi:lipopolysaccharide transport system ATP-binding protein
MAATAIRVEGVGKQYRLGQALPGARTLRETLTDLARTPFRRLRGSTAPDLPRAGGPGMFWALRDVRLEIAHGETVGIIGRNGAGKSTLLKILSRITPPTVGTADIHGRAGALLEVGTGFHPELTGRENVFLNGAILGMRRADIRAKFDDIVAFAELERFIDTPVKRYSSGMYLRLAFAVAAHLEPDILIIDEVLAVGDARFQRRCLSTMHSVAREGRTVLFVSHDMTAVTRLCRRVVLIDNGVVTHDGAAPDVVRAYLDGGLGTTAVREWPEPARAPAGDAVRLRAVRVRTAAGTVGETIDVRQPFRVEMEYEVLTPGAIVLANFDFVNEQGIHVFAPHDLDPVWRGRRRPRGRYVTTVSIPGNLLAEGAMFVGAGCRALEPSAPQFFERDAVAFQVVDSLAGDSARGDYAGRIDGVVRPLLEWRTELVGEPVPGRNGAA